MDTVLFFCYTGAYVALLCLGVFLAARHGWVTPANVLLVVIAGLVYDNTVISIGRFIGASDLLEGLNLARFWLHAFLTPLLVLFAWHSVVRAGLNGAKTAAARIGAVVLTVGLIILEVVTQLIELSIVPREEYGVLSYSSEGEQGGVPLMVLIVAAVLIVAGFVVWRRQGWIWLLVGSVVMVIGSAVPIPLESGAITNAFELILLTALLATKARQDQLGRNRVHR